MKQQMFKKVAQDLPAVGNVQEKSPKKKSRRKDKIKPTDILKPVPPQTDEEADTRKKMPKGLPSHWGPKVSSDFDILKISTVMGKYLVGTDHYCFVMRVISFGLSHQIKLCIC